MLPGQTMSLIGTRRSAGLRALRRGGATPAALSSKLPSYRTLGPEVAESDAGAGGEPSLGESLRIGSTSCGYAGAGGCSCPANALNSPSRERRRHGRCFEWPWLIRLRLGKVMVRGVHGAHDAGGAVAGPHWASSIPAWKIPP
jgi:hypothetical protein